MSDQSAAPATFLARVAPTPGVPPTPSGASWSQMFNSYGALIVTIIIFALFATNHSDDTMKALAMLAGGYWLGSSNSSQKKDDTITAAQQALATSAPVSKP